MKEKLKESELPFRVYDIPFSPVSLNHAYGTQIRGKGRKRFPVRFLQPGYKAFKEAVKMALLEGDAMYGGPIPFKPPFAIYFLFLMERSSWYYKKGTWKRRDLTNHFKLLEDACSEHWGFDDKFNVVMVGQKRWVPDGSLKQFDDKAYHNPPHKDFKAVIRVVIRSLPEGFSRWDGHISPVMPGLFDV